MGMIRRAVYEVCRVPVTLGLRTFFRRIDTVGEENLPPGPVVVAANHPNMLLDPLLVAMTLREKQVNFLAKAPLFSNPLVALVLRTLGVLPVYRKQDFPDKMGENASMFSACTEALNAGESIGIFPEGVSASDPRLQPLKTGAARILLEAAAAAGPDGVRPKLLPAGLNYGDRRTFRSDVVVCFGPPLDPAPYLERWEADPIGAARALTDALQQSLQGVVRNLARAEDERVVARLERVYRAELLDVGDSPVERLHLSRTIVDGYEHFRRQDPERVRRVEELLDSYCAGLEAFDVSGAHLREGVDGYTFANVLRFLLWVVPPLVLVAPLALWGAVMNGLPYNLTDPLARRGGAGPEEVATNKVMIGAALFALFYALQTAAVAWWCGGAFAALYLVTLPGTGFAALWWLDQARYLIRHARTFVIFLTRRGFRARMESTRAELLAELDGLAEAYLAARTEGPVGAGGGAA